VERPAFFRGPGFFFPLLFLARGVEEAL